MTPVYFPYTYLPDSIRTAVLSLFGEVVVYRPLSSDPKDKETEPPPERPVLEKLPLAKYGGMIEKTFSDHLNWAEYFETDQLRNLKSQIEDIPFFDDASSFKIKSEISATAGRKEERQIGADFKSGLFLMYAEHLDRRNMEINSGLQTIQKKADDMLKELKGADSFSNGTPSVDDAADPFAFMIKERINAWASLMMLDIPESCFFLTPHREVVSLLIDDMAETDCLLDYPGIPLCDDHHGEMNEWKKKLRGYISKMAQETGQGEMPVLPPPPGPVSGKGRVSFKLYRITGAPPHDVFLRFSPGIMRDADSLLTSSNYNNTLIGLVRV